MGTFVMIGTGNVAWHLSEAFIRGGLVPLCVFGRSAAKAKNLSAMLHCPITTNIKDINPNADLYVIAVKDDAIAEVIDEITTLNERAICVHTAGSVSINVFRNKIKHYGVLYPLQSFTKGRTIDMKKIPFFVEGDNADTVRTLTQIVQKISEVPVMVLDSDKRRTLHLAAVFASNFVNHCYACAADIVKKADIPFNALLPLIEETCNKVHEFSPEKAQTGPAIRFDNNILTQQESMLNGTMRDIYRIMSESIHKKALLSDCQ